MKTLHITLISICLLQWSCSGTEKGAAELEGLSKKVFETFRSADEDKFKLLIPGENAFDRYTELNKQESGKDLGSVDVFRNSLIKQFNTFLKVLPEMEGSIHANFIHEQLKQENTSRAVVTTKFTTDGIVSKYTFDAVKLNSRWYCIGNFTLLAPDPQ